MVHDRTAPVCLSRDESTGQVKAEEHVPPKPLSTFNEYALQPNQNNAMRIIVWEIQRKELDAGFLGDIYKDLDNYTNLLEDDIGISKEQRREHKKKFVGILKEALGKKCTRNIALWLDEKADDMTIISLCHVIRSRLQKANGNIVDFNPVRLQNASCCCICAMKCPSSNLTFSVCL